MRRRIVSAGPGLSAWMLSCLLHTAILAACIPLFRSVPKDSSESFLWTISLIGSPDSAPEETGLPEPPTGHEPSQAIVAKSPDMAPSQPAPAALSTPAPPPQAAPPSEAPAATPPPAVSSVPALSANVESPAAQQLAQADLRQDVIEEPAPPQPMAAEEPRQDAVNGMPPAETAVAPPLSTAASMPATPPAAASAPAADSIGPTSSAPAVPASISPSAAASGKADYGWLQRAVSQRLEALKRSWRPHLHEAGRLRVLVKAVVSSGGELVGTEIVTSSGHDRVDQEALSLVQRAFPLILDRAIDRPQIVMRIPIIYARD